MRILLSNESKLNIPGPEVRSRFTRWLVIEDNEPTTSQKRKVICRCDCGVIRPVVLRDLFRGVTKSCGCLGAEASRARWLVHGHTSTRGASPTYESWANMIQRCTNPNNHKYPLYGARGVRVCERWRNSFSAFLADVGERPKGTTLDRYPDRDGNYEPGNVRWATAKEQANNRRPRRRGYTRKASK